MAEACERALNFFKVEDYDSAIREYAVALTSLPKDQHFVAYSNQGLAYMNLGKYKQAIQCFGLAIENCKDHCESRHNMGVAYLAMGDYEKAIEQFDKALQIQKDFTPALCAKSEALVGVERYAEALQTASKAIQIDAKDYIGHTTKAFALLKLGRFEESLRSYDRAKELGDDTEETEKVRALAQSEYALELERSDKCDLAIEFYEKALKVRPTANGFHNMGILLLRAKAEKSKVVQCFLKAINLNPKYIQSLSALGALFCQGGDYAKAIKYLRRVCDMEPKLIEPRYNLAFALLRQGERREALHHFRIVVELDPTHPEARHAVDMLELENLTDDGVSAGYSYNNYDENTDNSYFRDTELDSNSPLFSNHDNDDMSNISDIAAVTELHQPLSNLSISETGSLIHETDAGNPIKCYTLHELQMMDRSHPYEGVMSNRMESHLTDDDFEAAFLMTREEFYGRPLWRQKMIKKDLGLF
uniref:HP domain-containing protein n=1 Tax=Aplanochytrium stocchinoi TaxID=215587 RepID=A0A7S3PRA8_9STRA|mmetsp:Transcript_15/g.14  ORF Transcript_15/g.14 Transcript_15/m.14 type:complete len:474 (+) Transcript_15:27-1448(+)|eukprot:CAMPEP_0204829562 /NCGR_PEP_ID=MMETSP1346-20131115/7807_1 /ASSEMBLY_ACC=CAM_ASM_000771 /TAXON_ID=215587 /ORGANISM="Aplanochytrium stocchinoi, Strain GSBS06" /LENGTH=473 /DNA_ID=CAMNT_0051959475 /DNA_START=42 /DNA_END=1463 /DNA_ORIENTATION=-